MAVLESKPCGKRARRKHYNEFRRLWRGMVPIAEAVHNAGGTMTIEWPRSCRYWKEPFVIAFMARYGLVPAYFDGCAFNLNSIVTGKSIKKP